MRNLIYIFVLICCQPRLFDTNVQIRGGSDLLVGGLFSDDPYQQMDYQAAADLVNEHVTYRDEHGLRLRLETFSTANKSSFHLSKMVCRALQTKGYHVLIGPSDPSLSVHVQSVCDAVDVPHLETHPSLDTANFYRTHGEFAGANFNKRPVNPGNEQRFSSINVHPRLEDINHAYLDFIVFRNWSRVALLYTGLRDGDGSGSATFHLQHLLLQKDIDCLTRKMPAIYKNDKTPIAAQLLELKQKQFTNILFELPKGMSINEFFHTTMDIGLAGEEVHFVYISLDFRGESLPSGLQELGPDEMPTMAASRSSFAEPDEMGEIPYIAPTIDSLHVGKQPGQWPKMGKHSKFYWEKTAEEIASDDELMSIAEEKINVTRNHLKNFFFFRLPLFDHPNARALVSKMKWVRRLEWTSHFAGMNKNSRRNRTTASSRMSDGAEEPKLDVETAVFYDTLLVLAEAVKMLNFHAFLGPTQVSCLAERSWESGATFFNYINSVETNGITGKIRFEGGRRTTLHLNLMHYSAEHNSIQQVGVWTNQGRSTNESLTILQPDAFIENNNITEMDTLIVVTKEEIPYVMMNSGKTGNAAYDGFAIDLLKAISDVLHFKFKLYSVPDDIYGVQNQDTGDWNGIVKQLLDRRADLAVASMTINHARETVIDFTKPFMNLGISILFKAPKDPETELFSFMNPLAVDIWMYILLAYILVSITIWIVARFSPYEWASPDPCEDTAGLVFQNDFTLPNSFWFAIGTLMQQGSDLNPRAASTRIVGGIWWFFTLIIISSYTANLAAFLTVERMVTPIESAEDLSDQNTIRYGTLIGGSTMTFFRDSKMERYQKMWRFMESHTADTFVPSYEEGVKRVLNGSYAFLGESAMLDYLVQRNCNLTQIGGLLDSKGYGIATPKGSKWRDKISKAILFLQEKGVIQMYYDKWWKSHGRWPESGDCRSKETTLEQKSSVNALGVVNIGGVFVVLLVGLAFAVMVAIAEFCVKTSSLNTNVKENIVQTSPLRRNSRKFTSIERRRSRKSLCAEIARTLVPRLICDTYGSVNGDGDGYYGGGGESTASSTLRQQNRHHTKRSSNHETENGFDDRESSMNTPSHHTNNLQINNTTVVPQAPENSIHRSHHNIVATYRGQPSIEIDDLSEIYHYMPAAVHRSVFLERH